MEIKDTIDIGKDFTDHPGARYKTDGEWSGERFLEELLLPKFKKALKGNYLLLINLDNLTGCPSSFVSGSFGKLSLDKSANVVEKHLRFKSEYNPVRLEKILKEIREPTKIPNES